MRVGWVSLSKSPLERLLDIIFHFLAHALLDDHPGLLQLHTSFALSSRALLSHGAIDLKSNASLAPASIKLVPLELSKVKH